MGKEGARLPPRAWPCLHSLLSFKLLPSAWRGRTQDPLPLGFCLVALPASVPGRAEHGSTSLSLSLSLSPPDSLTLPSLSASPRSSATRPSRPPACSHLTPRSRSCHPCPARGSGRPRSLRPGWLHASAGALSGLPQPCWRAQRTGLSAGWLP